MNMTEDSISPCPLWICTDQTEEGCDGYCSSQALARTWRIQENAWKNGEIAQCVSCGILYRVQLLAATVFIPAELSMCSAMLCCGTLCTTCATLSSLPEFVIAPINSCCMDGREIDCGKLFRHQTKKTSCCWYSFDKFF